MNPTRREFLIAALACAGCGGRPSGGKDGGAAECSQPSDAGTGDYCLVTALRVRVAEGTSLQIGQAMLLNVNDNTAVIVARDDKGLYARSGICTHACCVVSLCDDSACGTLTPSPLACETTRIVRPDPENGVVCPCHGSTFRLADGRVTQGPARLPLPAYALEVQGNVVWVDTGATVDANERV